MAMWLELPLFFILSFSTNVYLTISISFFLGITNTARITIGFVYFVEFMPSSKKSIFSMMFNINEGLTLIWISLIYAFATNSSWPWIIYALTSHCVFTVLSVFIPESACYLVGKKKYEAAHKAMDVISKVNG